MDFILRHWQGRLSVFKSVWVSGILAFLVSLPVDLVELRIFSAQNNIASVGDIVARAQDGSLAALTLPPFPLQLLDHAIGVVTLVWWSVGTWRACDNPANNKNGRKSWWGTKLTIILSVLYELYDWFDFITTFSVS